MVASGNKALHREKQAVIEQALRQGKGYKEIASEFRISFKDISRVAKDMLSPAPFDVLDMVVEEMTPQDKRTRRDRVAKIDRWLYRYEYYSPRIGIATRSYEPLEEIANMMHVSVRVKQYENKPVYSADSFGARAVRICHLIQPHLRIPEKQARAAQVLNTYRQRPATRA